jgi:manganese transport protein
MLGPAFIAAIAYVDPGNFATNFQGGAQFGYMLLWVVLAANLMAMLIQYLSAKLGIATGRNLPELCRDHYPRLLVIGLWLQSELIAIATDLAEFVGAALALNLLFGLPLGVAGLLTAAIAFVILDLQRHGYRRFEAGIIGLLAVVLVAFSYEALRSGPSVSGVAQGLVPRLEGSGSLLLAVGILGATVMPHVIYLHSALTQDRVRPRDDAERAKLLRFESVDVLVAMSLAGVVNMLMLAVAARLFAGAGGGGADTIQAAHSGIVHLLGPAAGLAFAVALLASGVSSSSVGTYAGQVVMQGFVNRRIPISLRRAITMVPSVVVLMVGIDPTRALVLSQVLLSFGIPLALVPLVLFTRRRDVMGSLVNHRSTTVAAWLVTGIIVALNAVLLYETLLAQ